MRTQYLFDITAAGKTTRSWFAPSDTLRTDEDTDLDAAQLSAHEWHWDADHIALVRDQHGKPVTRLGPSAP